MTGNITVLGLQSGTCILEDITMDVPHGTAVLVPAEKAARSRDLWRAISQRHLFQINPGMSPLKSLPNPLVAELESLRERVRCLEEENRVLREAQKMLEGDRQSKLDAILGLLQGAEGASLGLPPTGTRPIAERAVNASVAVVEVAPPPYIPSKIRPEEAVQAHVQAEVGSSEGTDVAGATTRLREMRQRGPQ